MIFMDSNRLKGRRRIREGKTKVNRTVQTGKKRRELGTFPRSAKFRMQKESKKFIVFHSYESGHEIEEKLENKFRDTFFNRVSSLKYIWFAL